MMSPNVDYHDPRSFLMSAPWGLQITKLILGSDFYSWEPPVPAAAEQYWYTRYRIEGLIILKSLIDEIMTKETFSKIDDPLYLTYYYKDEKQQDDVVSVKRMQEMYAQVGTPASLKKEVALLDAGTHIIGSDIFNQNLQTLWTPLTAYCENVLHLSVVNDVDWKPFLDIRTTN